MEVVMRDLAESLFCVTDTYVRARRLSRRVPLCACRAASVDGDEGWTNDSTLLSKGINGAHEQVHHGDFRNLFYTNCPDGFVATGIALQGLQHKQNNQWMGWYGENEERHLRCAKVIRTDPDRTKGTHVYASKETARHRHNS